VDVHWVDRVGGVRIPYVVLGSGAVPRLLFAHSLLAAAVEGAAVFQPIVDAGWTVVAMDQRGHGRAEGQWTASDFELEVLGADLLAVMDDLGWPSAWLGGGSMGAATSTAAALAAPARIEGLALLAPAMGAEPNPALGIFNAVADAFVRGLDAGLEAWAEAFRPGSVPVPDHAEALRRLGPLGAPAALRAVAGWRFGTIPCFDFPVITSAWKDDPCHPTAVAQAFAAASPAGRFHELDMGAEPDIFTALARQLPPPA